MSDITQKNSQLANDKLVSGDPVKFPSLQESAQANIPSGSSASQSSQALDAKQGQVLSEAVANVVNANHIQRLQLLQVELNTSQANYVAGQEVAGPSVANAFKKYFADTQFPYITRSNQRKFAETEEDDGLNEERGDLFMMELKQHLAQLSATTSKSSYSAQKGASGKTSGVSRGNISALLHEKMVSMLNVFPWFYNFIKGVVLMRTTKQD